LDLGVASGIELGLMRPIPIFTRFSFSLALCFFFRWLALILESAKSLAQRSRALALLKYRKILVQVFLKRDVGVGLEI